MTVINWCWHSNEFILGHRHCSVMAIRVLGAIQ
jgi:hypothetical protein